MSRAGESSGGKPPIARQFGLAGAQPRSPDEPAAQSSLDPAFGRAMDEYLVARRRLHVARSGWRAANVRAW
jgi:hypothetical protein